MFQNLFLRREIPLKNILKQIEAADDIEINQIIDAVTRRYLTVFPDEEILFLSVPRDPEKRNAQLALMLEQLKMEKLG